MKLSIKPLAIAVAVGLASTAAHAQLAAPTIGTAAPPLTGLYVSIWDTTSQHSELVNLSYAYSNLLPSTGNLAPNSATGPYVTATNPAGSGSVLQLNFGVLPGFSSTFGTPGSTTSYMVTVANAQAGLDFTETPAQAALLTTSSLTTAATSVNGQIANWTNAGPGVANSGEAIDLTGTANYNALVGPVNGGNLGLSGFNFSGTVGTALDFFNLVPNTAKRGTVTLTQYANAQGAGFWFLSSTGDLTYNVPASTSPVPLPAAVWLLVSGLAGLGAIGRRRNAPAA
jgi:hypothetical protein